MISLVKTEKDFWVIRQTVNSPFIYLDLNSIITLSRNEYLAKRFAETLAWHEGTIAFSWVHLVELSGVQNKSTLMEFAHYLQTLEKHLAFIDTDAIECQKREESGEKMPFLDEGFAKLLLTHAPEIGRIDLVHTFQVAPNMKLKLLKIRDSKMPIILNAREKNLRSNYNVRAYTGFQRCPQLIHLLGLDALRKQTQWNLEEPNHWADWLHSTVSFTYCDAVALDGNWVEQCRQHRIFLDKQAPGKFKTALVFRGDTKGLHEFVSHLERLPRQLPPSLSGV